MIDPLIAEYAEKCTSPVDAVLRELERETHLKTLYPRMMAGPYQGKMLEMFSRMIRPVAILEIGTFTGYSCICLAKGLTESGRIHTIESDPEMVSMAEKYFQRAGIRKSVFQYNGDALGIIPQMDVIFDLVFIDAAKDQYVDYYRLVFPKVRKGGFILADNTLWDGKALGKAGDADREAQGIIDFNNTVSEDPRVDNILLTVRDGVTVIRKTGE